MAYSAGSASIDIKPSLAGFAKDLKSDLRNVDAEFAVDIKPSLAGFVEDLRSDLDKIDAGYQVDVSADLTRFREQIARVESASDPKQVPLMRNPWME